MSMGHVFDSFAVDMFREPQCSLCATGGRYSATIVGERVYDLGTLPFSHYEGAKKGSVPFAPRLPDFGMEANKVEKSWGSRLSF
jgi:hypothetical protein